MTIVRPIQYSANAEAWHRLATTLGLTPAFEPGPAWTVFDGDGRLAVHGVIDGDPLHGTLELNLIVDDLDAAQTAIEAAGFTPERRTVEDVGDLLAVTFGDVQVLVEGAEEEAPATGPLAVQPIWYSDDLAGPQRFLTALGLTLGRTDDDGEWVELVAGGGGRVGLHRGEESSVELALTLDGDVAALAATLEAAEYHAGTRTRGGAPAAHVTTPDGWELWVTGR